MHASNHIKNPIDNWYFYWAGHDGGGIWLSTAPNLNGPWTVHDQLFTANDVLGNGHISSPYPVVDQASDRILLYYHSHRGNKGQSTAVAELDLDKGTELRTQPSWIFDLPGDRWDGNERSYLKVLQTHSGEFIGVYQGRDASNSTPGFGFGTSSDGINWSISSHPAYYNSQVQDKSGFIGGPHLLPLNGEIYLLYQDRARPNDSPEGIYVLPWEKRDHRVSDGKLVLAAEQSWTNDESLHVVDHVFEGDTLYLFYADSTAQGTQSIGFATATAR
ncbi:hypothetical protein ACOZ32_05135 [Halobacterium sp. MBLA0001]|uniref:hypothetical protein n=1 Tax=Halobacterium sp. MBLA0001 TaxID=3413511 RepID=UPI003C72317D